MNRDMDYSDTADHKRHGNRIFENENSQNRKLRRTEPEASQPGILYILLPKSWHAQVAQPQNKI